MGANTAVFVFIVWYITGCFFTITLKFAFVLINGCSLSPTRLFMDEQPEINIEEIMAAIRQKLMAEKITTAPSTPLPLRLSGKRLPPEYYEYLYQAGMSYDQVGVELVVTSSKTPLIGPFLHWVRTKLHEVVLFYVNRHAVSQIQFNAQLLQALNTLSATLEEEKPTE